MSNSTVARLRDNPPVSLRRPRRALVVYGFAERCATAQCEGGVLVIEHLPAGRVVACYRVVPRFGGLRVKGGDR